MRLMIVHVTRIGSQGYLFFFVVCLGNGHPTQSYTVGRFVKFIFFKPKHWKAVQLSSTVEVEGEVKLRDTVIFQNEFCTL